MAALEPRVEPRVYERDGFAVTLWTYYEPVTPETSRQPTTRTRSSGCTPACDRLDVATPHFTDRVAEAQQLVTSRDLTPALADADRELLGGTLRDAATTRSSTAALPSSCCTASRIPGNVLSTQNGLVFIDLETCCRGPVEFDLAHAPEDGQRALPGC